MGEIVGQNRRQSWTNWNQSRLEELGITDRQHAIVQVDILQSERQGLTNAHARAIEQQEQRPHC